VAALPGVLEHTYGANPIIFMHICHNFFLYLGWNGVEPIKVMAEEEASKKIQRQIFGKRYK
jgi:hypothetical protein